MLPALRLVLWLVALAAAFPRLAAADPPARVGRLSLIEGSVAFRADREDGGGPASLNWPVSSGAIIDTGRSGRAEIQVGSNAFRLDADSRVEFVTVNEERITLQIAQGSLAVSVRDDDQAEGMDINTPAGQVRFDTPGRYRIDVVRDRGQVEVSSREGQARIQRPGGELSVGEGQRGVAYAGGGWFVAGFAPDAFDAWADSRDDGIPGATARRYVSPQMTGYEDLDRYGNWSYAPDYGPVWYPSAIPVGWAPYRHGRWAWVAPWGWTWIDEAPWGFAPFHYGRWAFIGSQWAWVPGAYNRAPVYAPALVAWIGNPGWSLSFGFGSTPAVGWFPLAPYEVFVPAYRHSPHYVRRMNAAHDRHDHDGRQDRHGKPSFAHRDLPQAVTVVPARIIQSGSQVTSAPLIRPDRQILKQAPVAVRAPDRDWLPPSAAARRPRPEHGDHVRPHPDTRPEGGNPARPSLPFEVTPAVPLQQAPLGRPENRAPIQLPPPAQAQPPATAVIPGGLPEARGKDFYRERRREERFPPPADFGAPTSAPRPFDVPPENRPSRQLPPAIQVQPAPMPDSRPDHRPEMRWRGGPSEAFRERHAPPPAIVAPPPAAAAPAARPEMPPAGKWSQERRSVAPEFERPAMAPPMPRMAPQPMPRPEMLPAPQPMQPGGPWQEHGRRGREGGGKHPSQPQN